MRGIADHRPGTGAGVPALQARGAESDRLLQGPRHGGRGGRRAGGGEPRASICARPATPAPQRRRTAVRFGLRTVVVVPGGAYRLGQAGPGAGARRRRGERQLRVRRRPAGRARALRPSTRSRSSTASTRIASTGRRQRRSRSSTSSVTRPTCSRSRSATPATSPRTGAAFARSTATVARAGSRRMVGGQASGAAPLVHGRPVDDPQTVATAIRIGNPASWQGADRRARPVRGNHRARWTTKRSSTRSADLATPRRRLLRACVGGGARGARAGGPRRRRGPGVARGVRAHRQRPQGSRRRAGLR